MHPILAAPVAGLHVLLSTYGLLVGLGIVAGLVLAVRRSRHPDAMVLACAGAVLVGGVASHLWHALLHGARGFSSMGGIVAGLATAIVVVRLQRVCIVDALDTLVPAGLVGLAVGRIGCFLGGCCFGAVTHGGWGVALPEVDAQPRHPVQVYEAALLVLLAVETMWRPRRQGRAAAIGIVGYGVVRGLTDCLRDPAGSDLVPGWTAPTIAQLCAVGFVLVGLAFGRWTRRRVGDDIAVPAG